jgi:hypothetical protein
LTGGLAIDIFGNGRINGVSIISDKRFKDNIKSLVNSNEILLKLKGYEYIYKRNEYPKYNFTEGKKYGFLAQEVQEVLPEAVHTGVDSMLSVNYDFVIPFLVEGYKFHQLRIDSLISNNQEIKEIDSSKSEVNINERQDSLLQSIEKLDSIRKGQEVIISTLIEQNKNYENRLTDLEAQIQFIKSCMSNMGLCNNAKEKDKAIESIESQIDAPKLYQNIPNPASNETEIPFYLPSTVNKANIIILTVDGKILSDDLLESRGNSSLKVNLGTLTKGQYLYKLSVEGFDIAVKSMIIY